jgi:ubiquinone/menaquinone biosynthesis C-methylase UbiE
MLARAQDKVTPELSDVLSFHQADLNARLEFPDARFDHVINISVLQATADPGFTLGELWRVLKPGGTLALLHVPRPESHALPLRQAIQQRLRDLGVRTPWKAALVAAKTWAERSGNTRYWTAAELQDMLKASRFDVRSIDHGPPIITVAEKTRGPECKADQGLTTC